MRAVADKIVPGGTVDDAVNALNADPARTITGKEAFRDWMQGLADRAIAELHGTHFDIPEQVRRIECCLAPTSDGGIYYTGPSEDFTRPGRMWWAVPQGIDSFSTWQEVTTVYHEGVPGHHLQIAPDRRPGRAAQPVAAAAVLVLRARRGLGALRRAAHGRARLPRRPGRQARHARRAVDAGRPGDRRHRHAPGAGDPSRQPPRRTAAAPSRSTRASAGPRSWAGSSCGRTCSTADESAAVRGQPVPGLAGAGAVVQGRRADLAAGPGRRPGPQGRRLRPQGVPPGRARPRRAGPRPAARALARL